MWSTGRTYTTSSYSEPESERRKLGRSRSLGATDTLEMLESHRLHRQQYLTNRSKFEPRLAPPNMPPPPVPQMKSSLLFTESIDKSTSVNTIDNRAVPTFQTPEKPKTNNPTVKYKQQMSYRETDSLIFHQRRCENTKNKQESEFSACSSKTSFTNFNLNSEKEVSQFNPEHPPMTIPENETESFFVRDFSRRSLQYQPSKVPRITKWERSSKTVKDITDAYLMPKQGQPKIHHIVTRRSSSSSIPVKLLAAKFSPKD